MLTNHNRPRIHHFHAYNRVRLTIYTLPFQNPLDPNKTLYAVGMALCHNKDNGSRLEGRELAKISADLAEKNFLSTRVDSGCLAYLISPGLAIFFDAETLKAEIIALRTVERYCTNCKALAIYNNFFRGDFCTPLQLPPQNEDDENGGW